MRKDGKNMERKELDKYKMISGIRLKECIYYLYELWNREGDSFKIHISELNCKSIVGAYEDLKRARIITVQIIAEETGKKYDQDVFFITQKAPATGKEPGIIYINIDRSAPFKRINTSRPVTKDTKVEEIKPYITAGLFNSLKRCKFETIEDTLKHSDEELMRVKCFGRKRLEELHQLYRTFSISNS